MITQVTASNKSRYLKLWEDATNDLKVYDANGEIAELSGTDPVITESIEAYAKIKVTVNTYAPGEFYYVSGYDDDEPVYTLDESETFDPDKEYFMQYDGAEISSLNEYFGYIQELAAINPAKYTRLPLDENYFEINANARTVTIPDDFSKNGVSVSGDMIAEILYFRINRYFDMDDLSTKSIFIEWTNANGRSGVSKTWTVDTESEPGYVIFGWPLDNAITEASGKVQFTVRFYTVDENKTLQYSWATTPATVEIKSSLNFDISALLAENDSDVIRRNDELIINRLVNSVVDSNAGVEATAPIFYDRAEVDGIATNFGDLPATFDMDDDNDAYNRLYAAAYSEDEGTITYRWMKTSYAPTTYLKITLAEEEYEKGVYYIKNEAGEYELTKAEYDENTQYYVAQYGTDGFDDGAVQRLVKVQTLDTSREESKTYFGQTSAEGKKPVTYKLYSGEINIDGTMVDSEGFTSNIVYENATCALPNGIGRYRVIATNRAGKSTASTDSTVCVIAPPDAPIVASPVETTSAILKADSYQETLRVRTVTPDRPLTKTTYQWLFKGPLDETFAEVDGETAANLVIKGAAYGGIDEVGKGDGFYKVAITNAINGETESIESVEWIVTHEPETPVVKSKELAGDDMVVDIGSNIPADSEYIYFELNDLPLPELAMKEALGVENEGLSYEWYRIYMPSTKDIEALKEQAYKGELTTPTDSDRDQNCNDSKLPMPTVGGYYYCIVTNTYNGQEKKCSTPLFQIVTD